MEYEQIRVTADVLARAFADSPITMYLVPKERARIITMRASRVVSGAIAVRSRSIIAKSASLPRASVPFSFSSNDA